MKKHLLSTKSNVLNILLWLIHNSIQNVVICPGSRNAPLIRSFAALNCFDLLSISDEKIAGFVALGIAKKNKVPVAICCTSGSALLNIAPAIAEAFYSEIPLIIISADRPPHEINRGDNQTMMQPNIFSNYCSFFGQLEVSTPIEKVFHILSKASSFLRVGPIHFNLPIDEPLDTREFVDIESINLQLNTDYQSIKPNNNIVSVDISNKRIWIYTTQNNLSQDELKLLEQGVKSGKWLWIGELLTNFNSPLMLRNSDFWIGDISPDCYPEVLITIGLQMISKKMRQWFRSIDLIHIDMHDIHRKWPIGHHSIQTSINIKYLLDTTNDNIINFEFIKNIDTKKEVLKQNFLNLNKFTDYWFCQQVINWAQNHSYIYWGNSSIIRLANWSLIPTNLDLYHLANRGVSGIEGVLATAIGFGLYNFNHNLICVIGDVSMIYELNSLYWCMYLKNIKVVLINNDGGKIFDQIYKDLNSTEMPFFHTSPMISNFEAIATSFDFEYHYVDYFSYSDDMFKSLLNKCGKVFIECHVFENPNLWQLLFNDD